jgi:hypothetical protein
VPSIPVPNAASPIAAIALLIVVAYEALRTNYKHVEGSRQELASLAATKPHFEFGFSQQELSAPERNRPQFETAATWFRVRVRNQGALARNCALSLESAAGLNAVAPGPLAATGVGGMMRDIGPGGVAYFDLGYCFHTDWGSAVLPASVQMSTWPTAQPATFKNRMQVTVRFTEDQSQARIGVYEFVQDAPGSSVWVDCEHALT